MRRTLALVLLLCCAAGDPLIAQGQQVRFLPREQQSAPQQDPEAAFAQPWPAAEEQRPTSRPQSSPTQELPARYRSSAEDASQSEMLADDASAGGYRPTPGQVTPGHSAALDDEPSVEQESIRPADAPRDYRSGATPPTQSRYAAEPPDPYRITTQPTNSPGSAPSQPAALEIPTAATHQPVTLATAVETSEGEQGGVTQTLNEETTADYVATAPDSTPAPLELGARPPRELPALTRPGLETDAALPRSGGPNLLTVAGSLALVLGLFFLVAWVFKRNMPRSAQGLPNEVFEPLGRASVGSKQQVQLLRVGRKLLLVSIGPNGTDTLTEITDPEEVDRLAGLCIQSSAHSTTRAFGDVLNSFSRDRHAKGFVGSAAESLTDLAAHESLARYRREYGDA